MTIEWDQLVSAILDEDYKLFARRKPYVQKEYERSGIITRKDLERVGEEMFLTINSFPYDVDAYHYIVWCLKPKKYEEVFAYVQKIVKGPFIIYKNTSYNSSIKHTQHYHVFTKLKI